MSQVYSGFIEADQGFSGPVPFAGPAGWKVDKHGQTEIFIVIHNLGLPDPHSMRIVVTTIVPQTFAVVESVAANEFRISVWGTNGASAHTGLMFVAVKV